MNKKLLSLENKIKNSRCQFVNKIWMYAIAPITIVLLGIILLCTVGFNGGTQLNGGSTFTVYINDAGKISGDNVEQYDINADYNKICRIISETLADGNLKAASFQKTQIDIEGLVASGDAIKVVYLNSSSDAEKIENENIAIRSRILSTFGYSEYPDAVTEAEHFDGTLSLSWAFTLVASIIFAITVALIYMALRTRSASWILGLVHVAIDLLLVASLMLVCRVPVSTTIAATLIVGAAISIANVFSFYAKAKANIANGKYDNLKQSKMADDTTKELAIKKSIVYIIFFIIALIFVVMPVAGLREFALGMMLTLIATFYTSTFILPAIWAVSYRPAKKKNKTKKEALN